MGPTQYREIRETLQKTIKLKSKHGDSYLDRIYLYCSNDLNPENKQFQTILSELADNGIEVVYSYGQALFNELRDYYPDIVNAYFEDSVTPSPNAQ